MSQLVYFQVLVTQTRWQKTKSNFTSLVSIQVWFMGKRTAHRTCYIWETLRFAHLILTKGRAEISTSGPACLETRHEPSQPGKADQRGHNF